MNAKERFEERIKELNRLYELEKENETEDAITLINEHKTLRWELIVDKKFEESLKEIKEIKVFYGGKEKAKGAYEYTLYQCEYLYKGLPLFYELLFQKDGKVREYANYKRDGKWEFLTLFGHYSQKDYPDIDIEDIIQIILQIRKIILLQNEHRLRHLVGSLTIDSNINR